MKFWKFIYRWNIFCSLLGGTLIGMACNLPEYNIQFYFLMPIGAILALFGIISPIFAHRD